MKLYNTLRGVAIAAIVMTGAIAAEASTPSMSRVVNPEVPMKMEFCGRTVSLDRADMFERLDRELTALAYTHGSTLLTIKRANRFFPVMAPILKKNNIPEDILYLACIESTLDTRALSPAKAAGLWQFIPDTGRQYGLEINEYVDERYHTEKATEAACRYLRNAYSRYGNWESVAASYNAGMGRISNELSRQNVESAFDLYLNSETNRYNFRMMATKLIMEHPSRYGFSLKAEQLYQPLKYETVEVSTPVADWVAWAGEHGISYMTLRDYNPWIRSTSLPNKSGKTYEVKIPVKDSNLRSKQKPEVYNRNWITD